MKGKTLTIIIIVAIIAILGIASVSSYNNLVNLQETVSQSKGDIDTSLQRRIDLIPNLVQTVKAYAKHEEEVFTSVANARSALIGAGNLQESAQANAQMSSALSRLLAISESYPELKANQNFIDLQTQLEGTENRINVARTKYNETARIFNAKIRKFPSVIFANMMGLEKADYFEAQEGADKAPTVNFD